MTLTDKFSFWLRRKHDESHFYICAMLYGFMPLCLIKSDMNTVDYWIFAIFIFIAINIIPICLHKAKQHNKPANVEPLMNKGFMYYCNITVTFLCFVYTIIDFISSPSISLFKMCILHISLFILVLLSATPGYKVPYEPDSPNLLPQGA